MDKIRGEGVYKVAFGGNTGYKYWRKKYKSKNYNIPQKVHGYILKDFGIALMNLMLFSNLEFKVPHKLGYFRVLKSKKIPKLDAEGKFDKKSLPIDYGASQKMWKEMYPELTRAEINALPNKRYVYYTNEHTNGYIMKLHWLKSFCGVKNNKIYSFKLSRDLQIYMAQIIKNNPQLDFYEPKYM